MIDGELPEIAEPRELCGYCAGEAVVVELDPFEAGELRELRGNAACEAVVVQVKTSELGESC